jgi:hypothetical protein
MTVEEEWTPVSISDRRVVDLSDGLATVHWMLGGDWNCEWAQNFTPTGTQNRSGGFLLAPLEPGATNSRFIMWTIPSEDIESADAYVKQSVEATNANYKALLVKNAQADAAEQEREKTRSEQMEVLQRKLDSLD